MTRRKVEETSLGGRNTTTRRISVVGLESRTEKIRVHRLVAVKIQNYDNLYHKKIKIIYIQ